MTQVIFPFLRTAEMFSGIFCFWGVKDQSFFPLNEKLLCFLFHVRLCCRSYTVKEVCPPLQNRAAPPSFSVIAHSFYTTFAEEFDIQVSFPDNPLFGIPTLPKPAKFGCDLFCCVTAGEGTGEVGQGLTDSSCNDRTPKPRTCRRAPSSEAAPLC